MNMRKNPIKTILFYNLAIITFLTYSLLQITSINAQKVRSTKNKQIVKNDSKTYKTMQNRSREKSSSQMSSTSSKKPNYDRIPFNLALETIPTGYAGHDSEYIPIKIYISDAYSTRGKGEFETTTEYQNKIDKALSEKIYPFKDDSITLKSLLAFKVQDFGLYLDMAYDADEGVMEMAAIPSKYQGDDSIERDLYYDNTFTLQQGTVSDKQEPYFTQNKQRIMVRSVKYPLYKLTALNMKDFHLEYFVYHDERNKPSYIPSVSGKKAIIARVKMSVEEAKELKGDVSSFDNLSTKPMLTPIRLASDNSLDMLLIGNLASPYLTRFDTKENPTLAKPVSVEKNFYYMNFYLKEIWFYNKKSGKIYSKIKSRTG